MKRLCVFCGSQVGTRPEYAEAARELGTLLAARGIGLVYGGGGIGLMGILADAVLAAHGEVIGVIPASLVARELAHPRVADRRVVRTMHERKALMADLADAFVALPGGFGTLDEFCEVLTWSQLGFHAKPCGLLNIAGYYDPLLQLFDDAVTEHFVKSPYRESILVANSPTALLTKLQGAPPPTPSPSTVSSLSRSSR